jgi:hypothetical protein
MNSYSFIIIEPEKVHDIKQTQEYRDKIRFTFYPPKDGSAELFEFNLEQKNEITGENEVIHTEIKEFKDDVTQYLVTFEAPYVNLTPGTDYTVKAVAKSGEIVSEVVSEKVSTGKHYFSHFLEIWAFEINKKKIENFKFENLVRKGDLDSGGRLMRVS